MTGIIVLLSIISATLAITSNMHVCKRQNETDCIKLVTSDKPFNNTVWLSKMIPTTRRYL